MAKKKPRGSGAGRFVTKKAAPSRVQTARLTLERDPKTGQFVTQRADKNSRVLATTIGGALIGNMLVPGLGGAIVGGLAGALLGNTSDKEEKRD